VRFFLVLIKALNGAFLTIFLRSLNDQDFIEE